MAIVSVTSSLYSGTSDADSIKSVFPGATIYGGGGNDTVLLDTFVFREPLFGNITLTGDYSYVDGGAGNDLMVVKTSNNGLRGNTGNDIISLASGNQVIYYESGDGNDVVYGYSSSNLVSISGASYTRSTVGSNLVLSVTGGGAMTLVGAANTAVNIVGTVAADTGVTLNNTVTGATLNGTAYADSISNSGASVKIYSGADNDYIYNSGASVTIDGGDGNDNIRNFRGVSATITGGAGNDSISNNYGSLTAIDGGAGDDSIKNDAKNVTITGGDGNDEIYNSSSGSMTVIDGGTGADRIENYGASSVTMNGGAGNDSIYNLDSSNIAINAGANDDYIQSSGNNVSINGGTGNDTVYLSYTRYATLGNVYVYSYGDGEDKIYYATQYDTVSIGGATYKRATVGSNLVLSVTGGGAMTLVGAANTAVNIKGTLAGDTNVTLSNTWSNYTMTGGAGNDSINNSGDTVKIYAGAGNDTVTNSGKYVMIDAGEGNDSIINGTIGNGDSSAYSYYGSYSSILGGAGDDAIENRSYDVTIDGGAGDDTIYNSSLGSGVTINGGTGNDTIRNYGSSVTINGGDGNDTIWINGNSVKIDSGAGNDSIYNNYGSDVTISGSEGNDSIVNWGGSRAAIDGGDGNDIIDNNGNDTTIDGGAGNDSIHNNGYRVKIDGGAGDDTIDTWGDSVTIDGGDGADTIYSYVGYNSIDGGAGADLISLNSTFSSYGNNTLRGGTGNDTVYLNSGTTVGNVFQYATGDGSDVVYKLTAYDTIHVTEGTVNSYSVSGNDVILNIGSGSITLKDMKGKAFNLKIGDNAVTTKEVIRMEQENYNDYEYIEGSSDDDYIYNEATGATISADDGDDQIDSYGDENAIFAGEGNDRVNVSGDYNSVYGEDGDDEINVEGSGNYVEGGSGSDLFVFSGGELTIGDYEEGDTIQVNFDVSSEDISYEFSDEGGVTFYFGEDGSIRIENIYDEEEISGIYFVDWSGEELEISAQGLIIFDGGELTIDNYEEGTKIKVTFEFESFTYEVDDEGGVTFHFDDENSIYIANGADYVDEEGVYIEFINSEGEYIYPEKVIGDVTLTSGADRYTNYNSGINVNALGGNDIITNDGADNVKIDLGAGNDSLYNNYGWNLTVEGGAGNDTIQDFRGRYSYINAGEGHDYISLSAATGTPTVIGGAGNDTIINSNTIGSVYQYSSGEGADVISGFNANDTLYLTAGTSITSATTSGDDVVLNFASGSITLKDMAGENIRFKIGSGAVQSTVVSPVNLNISLTGGNDNYTSTVDNQTIHALSGNDFVYVESSNVVLYGEGGDDTLVVGDDSSDTTVYGGAGNDFIDGIGTGGMIYGEDGNDTLKAYSNESNGAMFGGNGADIIINNSAESVYMDGGEGNDTIQNGGAYATVNGGAGNDYIHSGGAPATIDAGDGADTVEVVSFASINGGAGNDLISLSAEFEDIDGSTITGGDGNDTIVNENSFGNIYQYASGEGNDVIVGYDSNDMLYLAAGSNITSATTSGDDVILNFASGSITLKDMAGETIRFKIGNGSVQSTVIPGAIFTEGNDVYTNEEDDVTLSALGGNDTIINYGNEVLISGGTGADRISNVYGVGVTVNGDAGNDIIYNIGSEVIINGGDGDDSIKNENIGDEEGRHIENAGEYVTIDGGAGNDTIISCGEPNVSINGGAGNDYISGDFREETTIKGGAGNDTIELTKYGGRLIQYASGDGNDIITGFKVNDTLQITSGSYTASISGDDWVINVGSGKITLKDVAANEYVTLLDDSGNLVSLTPEPPLPSGWKYNTAKTIATASIASAADFDASEYDNIEKIDASKITRGAEIIAHDGGVSIKAGKGADIIYGGAGDDTVSLGAGADVYVYTGGEDVIQDYGTGADVIQLDDSEFEFVGSEADTVGSNVVYTLKDKDDNEATLTLLKARNKTVTFVNLTGETIDPYPPEDLYVPGTTGKDKLEEARDSVTIDAFAGNDTIVSSGNEASINAGAGADKISLTGGENITVYGGAGVDTIYNESDGGNVYQFNIDNIADGKDIIVGYSENDTIYIDKGIYKAETSGNDWKITIGSGSANVITLKDAADKVITVADGAGNVDTIKAEDPLPYGWAYGNTAKTQFKATIAGAEDINLIDGGYGSNVVTIDGSKVNGGIGIVGNDNSNSIKGGRGADIIEGGTGDDTVSLGAGADTYVYNGGTDIIQDFGTGADVIQISDTGNISLSAVETVGNNILITTSQGTITLNKASGKGVTIYGADDSEILYPTVPVVAGWSFTNNKQVAKATVAAPEDIDLNEAYGSSVITVNGASATNGLNVIGNDNGNSIKTGRGDDCIVGGYGNDTVSLGAGNDIYVYTGGEDVIQDYFAGADTIKVDTGSLVITSYETVGSDFKFTFNDGDGTLLIKKGKGKEIIVVDQDDEQIYPTIDPLPAGWSKINTGLGMKVTATAPEDLDLTESYGDGVLTVDGSASKVSVNIIGNDSGNSIKGSKYADEIKGGTGDDIISLGGGADTYVYAGGNDTILDFATIDAIYFTEDIAYENAASVGSDYVFTTNEGTLTIKNGKAKAGAIYVYDANGEQIHPAISPIPTGWQVNGTLAKATVSSAESDVDFNEDFSTAVTKIDASKITTGANLIANDNGVSIKGGKGADEITGGLGNDTVSLGGGADVYIYTGGDDYIQDYGVGADSIQFSGDVTFDAQETLSTDVVLTTNVGNVTVKGGKSKDIIVMNDSGERIYAVPAPDPLAEGWGYNTNHTQIKATVTAPYDLDLTESYGTGVTTVDGSKATAGINVTGNDEGNSIKGGRGADCIVGGLGNDTVSLGGGADVYVYTGGEDLIQDYNAVDSLVLGTNEYALTNVETVSTNVVYTFNNGEGAVTVKGGKGKVITFVDEDGDPLEKVVALPEGWNYTNNDKKLTATIASAEDLDLNESYGDGVATVDATKVTGGVEIIAHDDGVSIKGGKGDDIIWGGAGNDTVSLGGGADVFVYQGGEDLVQDYVAGKDFIQFDTDNFEIEGVATVSSNVVYTFANDVGTLTIKSGKGKTISFIDSSGDAISMGVSGSSKSLANDLFYDDNFMTNDAQIADVSEITAANYSVGKVETGTVELAQDTLGTAVTFAQEK